MGQELFQVTKRRSMNLFNNFLALNLQYQSGVPTFNRLSLVQYCCRCPFSIFEGAIHSGHPSRCPYEPWHPC